MKWSLSAIVVALSLYISYFALVAANPVSRPTAIVIDTAPSVVSYQGSSHAHTNLVIAPMGRSLGYIEPDNLNHTLPRNAKLQESFNDLNISPVYVHQ